MGKIQDALDKLKDSSAERAPGRAQRRSRYTTPAQQSRYGISFTESIELDWASLSEHGLLPEKSAAKTISQQYRRVK